MNCLIATITHKCERITASASRVGEGVNVWLSRVSKGISVSLRSVSDTLRCYPTDAALHLNAKCSLVCTPAHIGDYLEVSPSETQWITDGVGVFFDVSSNMEWIVLTD